MGLLHLKNFGSFAFEIFWMTNIQKFKKELPKQHGKDLSKTLGKSYPQKNEIRLPMFMDKFGRRVEKQYNRFLLPKIEL